MPSGIDGPYRGRYLAEHAGVPEGADEDITLRRVKPDVGLGDLIRVLEQNGLDDVVIEAQDGKHYLVSAATLLTTGEGGSALPAVGTHVDINTLRGQIVHVDNELQLAGMVARFSDMLAGASPLIGLAAGFGGGYIGAGAAFYGAPYPAVAAGLSAAGLVAGFAGGQGVSMALGLWARGSLAEREQAAAPDLAALTSSARTTRVQLLDS